MDTVVQQNYESLLKEGEIALERGQLDDAERLLRQCLELQPHSARAWSKLGVTLVHKGNKDKARECFEKAISVDDKYAPAYSNLGNIYREAGNLEMATKLYEMAINCDPNFATAYHNLGVVLKQQGKVYEGVNNLKKAGKLARASARAEFHKVPKKQRYISYGILLAIVCSIFYLIQRVMS